MIALPVNRPHCNYGSQQVKAQNSICAHLKKIENFFSTFTTPNALLSLILKMPGNNPFVRSEYLLITPTLTLLCPYFIFTYPAVRLFFFFSHLPCCAFILFRLYSFPRVSFGLLPV